MPENAPMKPAYLILENGEEFTGVAPQWQKGNFFGEVVFNTGMTGYVETLTDPSYAGQILVFTYPLLGNYGVPLPDTWESEKIHARGVILQSVCENPNHYASQKNLLSWLEEQQVPVLCGVDTRAITKTIREHGVALGAIICDNKAPSQFEKFDEQNWVQQVSIPEPVIYNSYNTNTEKKRKNSKTEVEQAELTAMRSYPEKKIIAVDCGMKANILRQLMRFPLTIKRVPYDYDYSNEAFDGVFISNGPGDPQRCTETIAILKKFMQNKKTKPIFGICLGTQLMALAIGAQTFKLRYGHRGQNQPCLDLNTGRAILTSQNHGYAIAENTLPPDWEINFTHLNDETVAGIQHKIHPWFSVQFHPEAAPGPHDPNYLFKKFYQSL